MVLVSDYSFDYLTIHCRFCSKKTYILHVTAVCNVYSQKDKICFQL